jgi:predicted nucleotidyltransferase
MSIDRVHGAALETAVQRTMNAAVADVLTEMGFPVTPVGTTGCHLVTATQRSASTS